ncbi:MAG: helix-turn-helix domain-containing protein, partial [Pseudobdellovibrio sp.]
MSNATFRFAKIIEAEFKKKQKRNARYSLRAFARDLDVSQSTASLLIRGKTGLSKKKAASIASKLGFTGEDLNYFVDLTVADCAKLAKIRKEAELRLNQHNSQFNLSTVEICRTLSSWYTIASLELLEIYGKRATEKFLADTLNVAPAKIAKSLQNLHTLKIIYFS